jgi:hypothetical protein
VALIPPFFMDCVVAIGADDYQGKRKWIASGFLYGYLQPSTEGVQKLYYVFLVSNRHVFEELKIAYLRFNPQANGQAREYKLNLVDNDNKPLWFANPKKEVDIAMIPININLLKEQAMQVAFFQSDLHVANIEKMNELGITEGDFAYVLGFPMGLVGDQRNAVIVRSGSIARIRDTLAKTNQIFLVDAFVFPGNSGGPVVSKPEALSIDGTKSQGSAYLIGIVQSYVPYQDIAISLQTKRPRVIFEENSGLAAVHPADLIEETIQTYLKLQVNKNESAKM